MKYKLSIVIPVFNKVNFTKACLRDLSRLTKDHEIIIVNNGSADYTDSYINQFSLSHENILNIKLTTNLGFGAASNIGYQAAQADNVLFLNNDIRVKDKFSNWTDDLLNKCDKSLVGPTMGLLDSKLNFVKESGKQLAGNSYLSGWCLCGSKKILDTLVLPNDVGPFSTDFFCYFEDTDLSFRAKKQKVPLKQTPVPVVHFGKQTSSLLNTTELYLAAKKIFLKKWSKK